MAKIAVLMTTATKHEAKKIVHSLLIKRLIACANILGTVESLYWWQGRIEKTRETLVLMKSDEKLFNELSKATKEMHSYETPEILALPIADGWPPYLEWLSGNL